MSEQQPNTPQDDFGQLTGHNYDGIQEYDNPTPAWWTWVFIVSIFFSGCYLLLHLAAAGGLSPNAGYERAAVANLEKKFGEIGTLEPDAVTLVQYMNEPEWRKFGENVYKANCVTCHGLAGEGNSGPNLTDDFFINVKSIEDIAMVIKDGAKAGAMPAWGNRLHPNSVVLVSAYVASLKGTNAPGGKGPEGDELADWPTLEELAGVGASEVEATQ